MATFFMCIFNLII